MNTYFAHYLDSCKNRINMFIWFACKIVKCPEEGQPIFRLEQTETEGRKQEERTGKSYMNTILACPSGSFLPSSVFFSSSSWPSALVAAPTGAGKMSTYSEEFPFTGTGGCSLIIKMPTTSDYILNKNISLKVPWEFSKRKSPSSSIR